MTDSKIGIFESTILEEKSLEKIAATSFFFEPTLNFFHPSSLLFSTSFLSFSGFCTESYLGDLSVLSEACHVL